jgi:ABC-type transporter Mla MlaB component
MLLRITQTTEGPLTVLTVAGRLVRDGVAELARAAQAAVPPLALDLTHLQQADADGIALLQALADAGAQLRGVSPYIALLLARP